MSTFETCQINCLADLMEEVIPVAGFQQSAFYRGQNNIYEPILPKLFRAGLKGTGYSEWCAFEEAIVLEFKQKVVGEFSTPPGTELEWRTQGAHAGLPTSVTTWSKNALMALWYATQSNADHSDGVIWRFFPKDRQFEVCQDHDRLPEGYSFYRPQIPDQAMLNQDLWALFHPLPGVNEKPQSLEEWYEKSADRSGVDLTQIRVPHELKTQIRSYLPALGVDAHKVRPDHRGTSRQIEENAWSHNDSYDWMFDQFG